MREFGGPDHEVFARRLPARLAGVPSRCSGTVQPPGTGQRIRQPAKRGSSSSRARSGRSSREHCYKCHGPDSGEGEGELRVDSLDALLRGGESGPAIVRGDPDRSLLILAVRHDGDVSMPPKKKLAQHEIDALTAWVKMGAPWPDSAESRTGPHPVRTARPVGRAGPEILGVSGPSASPAPRRRRFDDGRARRSTASSWRGWRPRGLRPAPPADKRTLLRRATLDLWGIPPSPEEIDAFLRDRAAQRLRTRRRPAARVPSLRRTLGPALAGPRPLRRQQRHGRQPRLFRRLALSRLRDRRVQRRQALRPVSSKSSSPATCWPTRSRTHRDELLVATGFLAIGPKMLAEDDPVKQQMDIVDEQLDTTCRVFMALTMGCARCHDHKFDPLDDERLLRARGDLQEHADDDLVSRRFEMEHARRWARFKRRFVWRISSRSSTATTIRSSTATRTGCRRRNARPIPSCWRRPRQEYAAIPKAMAVAEGSVGRPRDLPARQSPDARTAGRLGGFPTILAGTQPAAARSPRTAAGSSWRAG